MIATAFCSLQAGRAFGRSAMASSIPGFRALGPLGWDDFIVEGAEEEVFEVPTVPCDAARLARLQLPDPNALVADPRFAGRVRWYLKPLAFGGDPNEFPETRKSRPPHLCETSGL